MVSQSDAAIAAVIVIALLVGLATAGGWVYRDARDQATRGRPVTGTLGSLQLQTPAAWLVACLLLPEVALMAYLDCRRPA